MTDTTAGLNSEAIETLKRGLLGPVIQPDEPGYEQARAVWNGMIQRRPSLIVRALGTSDVIATVNFVRERGLPLSIKGGGHNIAGLAVENDAILLDMSLMRGVWVDTDRRVARAQAGCLLSDVDRETQLHGLATVLGFVSQTGIAGLTLGGGFGYLTRRFGWTCDNLVGMDVVTADGRLVRASENDNPELFWALRGGGGNFGVVTGFDYRLHEVGPQILGGAIAWPADKAPQVLDAFRNLTETAPPEMTCVLALRKAPPAPWLKPEIHGKDMIATFICYSGDFARGEQLLQPLRAIDGAVGDIVQPRPYITQQSLLDATQPAGRRYYWKSEYVGSHDLGMLQTVAKHAAAAVSPNSAILVFPLDGGLNGLPADYSPVGNRDAKSVFNVTASWDDPQDDARNIDWARNAWQELRQYSTGGTYVNFLTEEESDDRVAQAYGGNLDRLAEIKAKWDPTNLFRVNKNIAPKTV